MLTRLFTLTGTHASFYYMGKRNPGSKDKQLIIKDVKDELTLSLIPAAVCTFLIANERYFAGELGLIGLLAGTSHSLAYSLGKYKALSEKEEQSKSFPARNV